MLTSVNAYADMRYYGSNEIQEKAREGLSIQDQYKEILRSSGSFYSETLVGYEEDDTVNREAFEIAEFTFDTTGAVANDVMTVTYEEAQELSWEVSVGGSVSYSDLFDMLEAEGRFDIARTSSTSKAVGANKEYTLPKNRSGSICIYAHGVRLEGKLVYEWNDIHGNSGTRKELINVLSPYRKYNISRIHFGRIIYD